LIDALDSAANSVYYRKDPFRHDSTYFAEKGLLRDSLPSFPDSVYRARMDSIDRRTPLDLEYNSTVQAFINLYANRRRELTSRILGMKEIYFPMIEETLDKNNIPLELKYLAVVESALNPSARSPAGATGLWQFMYRTGKLYDLEVGSYVDERRDPYKSTQAASEYLSFLYGIYEDWNLVLAAYNAGPGTVNRAMRRAGGIKDYWELRPYLPRETRGYVPAFIAVNYIANYYEEHGIVPIDPGYRYFEFDTVHVRKPVTFEQISRALDISKDTLEMLNPVYRRGEVPATKGHRDLRLPRSKVGVFLANEDSIHRMDESPVDEDGYITEEITKIHRVRRGEYLGAIAQRYGVRISQLRAWNNLRGSRIHPGDRLTIHKTVRKKVEEGKSEEGEADAEKKKDEEDAKDRYHVVRRGDTLWDIARKYQGVTIQKLRSLNADKNIDRLSPGQKLLIQEGPS
jgi:membrane-bound lytic murein transglycosylase D